MKYLFIEYSDINYDLESLSNIPLGGTQSVIINLTNELIREGNEVIWLSKKNKITIGNSFFNLPHNNNEKCINYYLNFLQFDIIIIINVSNFINDIYKVVNNDKIMTKKIPIYYYIHHYIDQPDVKFFSELNPEIKYLFVSEWQKNKFIEYFGLNIVSNNNLKKINNMFVIPNSVSPYFENIEINDELINKKTKEIGLIYASVPNRGLDILLDYFINYLEPLFRNSKKKFNNKYNEMYDYDIKLHICSDFKVYNLKNFDQSPYYKNLYDKCKNHPNIIYHGTVSSKNLSEIMKKTLILCYPNTYIETNCITISQAIMSGNYVISSKKGALEETTYNIDTSFLFNLENDVENDVENDIENDIEKNWKKCFTETILKIIKKNKKNIKNDLIESQSKIRNRFISKNQCKKFVELVMIKGKE